jgi:NO-binding membrane sensor protein with MHYT domain
MPNLPLSPILWAILAIVFLVWIGMSAVLVYHWNTYAKDDRRARRMKRAFFIGSLVLFVSAVSFIFSV